MKHIISIFVLLPLISLAVELHPYDDCVAYKSNMVNIVDDFYSLTIDDSFESDTGYLNESLFWLDAVGHNINLHINNYNHDRFLSTSLEQLDVATNEINTFQTLYLSNLSTLSNSVYSLDCSQCPASSTNATGCCDFSEIIEHIDLLRNKVELGNLTLSTIDNYVKTYFPSVVTNLQYLLFLTEHGFDNVTNQMIVLNDNITNILSNVHSVLDDGFNSISNSLWFIVNPSSRRVWEVEVFPQVQYIQFPYYSGYGATPEMLQSPFIYNIAWNFPQFTGLLPSLYLQGIENIGIGYAQLNWEQYKNDLVYPPITNSLHSIYQSETNFFSFFRGEIGVQGVLASWTPERGTYYDYLTNHYLSVVMGDRLSAEFSANTNWFSRIESLLAALVFADGKSTNTVSTSSYQSEQTQLRESARAIQSISQNHMSIVREDVGDILELYQSYVNMYDNITMPQRIVLFTLSNQTDTDADVVSFSMDDNPGLVAFVEGCRAVTTFCWASVGIFCLLRFVFWAAKGVYYACKFIFSVISSIFK